MDSLDLLTLRCSTARLRAPAPTELALKQIMRAALRAPDHGGLRPWRHIIVSGEGLEKLGRIFTAAAERQQLDSRQIERAGQLPLRAPMVIITVVRITEHPKVPAIEQYLSAGCAVMAMQQAAQAQGFGGIWRTGSYASDTTVHQQLALAGNEGIVGFLYLGTPVTEPQTPRQLPAEEYFSRL